MGSTQRPRLITLNVGDLDDVSGPRGLPTVTLDADDVDVYVATEWGGNALGGVLTDPNPRLGQSGSAITESHPWLAR